MEKITDLYQENSGEKVSNFALNVGKLLEGLVHEQIAKIEERNQFLEAKILTWSAQHEDPEFKKYFGIHDVKEVSIKLNGAELIQIERSQQILKHGRSVEQDVRLNTRQQLLTGAIHLLTGEEKKPVDWDADIWEKMYNKPYRERLIIAGALLAAEIDRIDNLPNEKQA